MKISPQATPEMTHIAELVKDLQAVMFTTVDDQGLLVSRPMSVLQLDGDSAFWFFTDIESPKADQLARVNLSWSDNDRGVFVSVSGDGEVDKDPARIEALWTPFAKPWFPQGPSTPNLALVKVSTRVAEYWDAPHSKMVRALSMAASIAAARPIGLGDHAVVEPHLQRK